jgi:hypothetical protein
VFFGGVLVGIPWMLNLYAAMQHPAYEDLAFRGGVVPSHAPLFIGAIALGAIILFLLRFPREDKEKYVFSLALILTPLITMNQQILTGKHLQAAHYHWHFHKPIAVIFTVWILFLLFEKYFKKDTYKKAFIFFVIAFSIFTGIFIQAGSYAKFRPNFVEDQKYGPVMFWLSEHAEKEAVVFSDEPTAEAVVTYTSLNVFHHEKAPLSLAAPERRMFDVMFTYYRLKGIDEKEAQEVFHTEQRGFIATRMYGIHYRQSAGSYEAIPDERINRFTAKYLETFKVPAKDWIRDIWKKYEVEYLVWDKKAEPEWNLDQFKFLTKVAEFGDLVIYTAKY